MKKLLSIIVALTGLSSLAQDSKISALTHRTTPFASSDSTVWAIPGVSNYQMEWTDLTNVLAGYFDATGAATKVTNGFPWGVLYDAAGAAQAATNTLNASALASGTVPEARLPVVLTSNVTFTAQVIFTNPVTQIGCTYSNGVYQWWSQGTNTVTINGVMGGQTNSGNTQVLGTNRVTKLRVGGAAETADAVNVTGSGRFSTAVYCVNTILGQDSIQLGGTGILYWSGRTDISSPAAGRIILQDDSSNTYFNRLSFGPEVSTCPALVASTNATPSITLTSGTGSGAANFIAGGTLTATNGVASNSRRLLAPVSISVTGSPFKWTNSVAGGSGGTNNVYVFIDGSGVTGSIGLNGTTIFSALAGADATVPLQPGEYVTVTYSIGTPVMFWKPF